MCGWCVSMTAGWRLRWSAMPSAVSSTISHASLNNGPVAAGPCGLQRARAGDHSRTEVAKGERERAAESDPRVHEVLARFPGAKLVEVRGLPPSRRNPMHLVKTPARRSTTIDNDLSTFKGSTDG